MFPFLKEKPVKIKFYFDAETSKKRFTVFDSVTLEKMRDGHPSIERLVILMSHFMVDETNQPLPEEKAVKVLEKLNAEDFESVSRQFIDGLNSAAVPKANGSGSSLPSEAGQAGTLPAGPTP